MQVRVVNSTATEKAFLEIQATLQKGNYTYIRPIDNEVKQVFDPIKNKLFNAVKDYAKDINFDSIEFKGDYDYNDEGGMNFHLGSVALYKGGEEVAEYKSDEWQFFDQCSGCFECFDSRF